MVWPCKQKSLRKDSPNKLCLPKQMGEDQSDDLELDGPITLRILDGIAWDFTQAKWWRWWKTVRCGGSILSYCPRNPHGKAGNEERRRRVYLQHCGCHCYLHISLQLHLWYCKKMCCVPSQCNVPEMIAFKTTRWHQSFCLQSLWI